MLNNFLNKLNVVYTNLETGRVFLLFSSNRSGIIVSVVGSAAARNSDGASDLFQVGQDYTTNLTVSDDRHHFLLRFHSNFYL